MKYLIFIPLFLFASINQKIILFYKKTFPNIIIKKIKFIPAPPKQYKTLRILFSPKSSSGNIKIDNNYYYIKITAFIPVYKAKKVIKQNNTIYNNVSKKIIPFKCFYSKPLNKINKNLVASNIISKNAIINKSNTKIAPDVFKGSQVFVIIQSKNILINAKAKALQDGYIGDIIKIRFRKKTIKAKITNKNIVKIE